MGRESEGLRHRHIKASSSSSRPGAGDSCFTSEGFGDSDSKGSACNAGDPGSTLRLARSPGGGNDNPLVFLPGKSHGRRSLEGYSPWGGKE